MAKAKNKIKKSALLNPERKNEILGIIFLAISALVFLSLISYNPNDLSAFTSNPNENIRNFAGVIGAYLAAGLVFLVGNAAFIVPLLTFSWALSKFWGKTPQKIYVKIIGTAILFIASSSLLALISSQEPAARFRMGGLVGSLLSEQLLRYFGAIGSYITLVTLFLLSILIATEFLLLPFVISVSTAVWRAIKSAWENRKERPRATRSITPEPKLKAKPAPEKQQREIDLVMKIDKKQAPPAKPKIIQIKPPKPDEKVDKAEVQPRQVGDFELPSLDLLNSPPPPEQRALKDDLEKNSRILEETLADFGIEVRVAQVEKGPIITRYELEPAPGVKITRIVALSDDIALAMKAASVRIVAPIPGKARVGVEVPNSTGALVYLKDVLACDKFRSSSSKLNMALGKDVSGIPLVTDLDDMPHLLIAGATGSGKTVCVNSIITSLLFNNTPDDLKFLMIDPKMVELACFNGIPHLLCPVVTDPKKVSAALSWVVGQMEERYQLFATLGVRNIDYYNEKAEGTETEKLHYIIVIIDELADLMMTASAEVENAITRLAQLARAVGIHIILATQRPSVDVITGVIKANFPSRISFKVASKVDSRTVLDMNGAEKLLGNGDMLFLRPGTSKPIRAQGSLVSDKEIEKVVSFIKKQRGPSYEESIMEEAESSSSAGRPKFEKDPLYDEALNMIIETGQASVSMLQRRLRLSHIRAARIVDMMEAEGVVGPYRGSKPREILIQQEQESE